VKKLRAELAIKARTIHNLIGLMLVDSVSDLPAYKRSILVAAHAVQRTTADMVTDSLHEEFDSKVSMRTFRNMCESARESEWLLTSGGLELFCTWWFNHDQMNQDLQYVIDDYTELQILMVKEYVASATAFCYEQAWAALQFRHDKNRTHRSLYTPEELRCCDTRNIWERAHQHRLAMQIEWEANIHKRMLYNPKTLQAQISELRRTHQLTDLQIVDGLVHPPLIDNTPSSNNNSTAVVPYTIRNSASNSSNINADSRSNINSSAAAGSSNSHNTSRNTTSRGSNNNRYGTVHRSSVHTQEPASLHWTPCTYASRFATSRMQDHINQEAEESGMQMHEILEREAKQKEENQRIFQEQWEQDMKQRAEKAKQTQTQEQRDKALLANRYVDPLYPDGKWESSFVPSKSVRDGMILQILKRNDPVSMWKHRFCPPPQCVIDDRQRKRARKANNKQASKNNAVSTSTKSNTALSGQNNSGSSVNTSTKTAVNNNGRLEQVFNTMTVSSTDGDAARTNNKHRLEDVYPDGDQEDHRDRAFVRREDDDDEDYDDRCKRTGRFVDRPRGGDNSDDNSVE